VIVADREMVESSSDDILQNADKVDVAFLVVGDPFGYVVDLCPMLSNRRMLM
jgi:diphthine methyl ester synthase